MISYRTVRTSSESELDGFEAYSPCQDELDALYGALGEREPTDDLDPRFCKHVPLEHADGRVGLWVGYEQAHVILHRDNGNKR